MTQVGLYNYPRVVWIPFYILSLLLPLCCKNSNKE